MSNELVLHKSWWKPNWKWLLALSGILLISVVIFFTSNMDTVATHLAQAYADTELYENALGKVKSDESVTALLGDIEPIDNLAILEGQVEYTNENKTVNSSIRIVGSRGKGRLDISAERINNTWNYTKITVRIKKPPEKQQRIEINTAE